MKYIGSTPVVGVSQAIIANMPPHDTYIELFLGNGTVMRKKPVAQRSIGVDINRRVLDKQKYRGVELYCGDAIEYLQQCDFDHEAGRVLIYCDPPMHVTRRPKPRNRQAFSENDHIRLLECLNALPEGVSVIVSGIPSPLYDGLLHDWRSIEYQVIPRSNQRDSAVTEKIWMNYKPDSSHWIGLAGINFTERQRIKRKAQRWADNYAKLTTYERIVILSAILERESKFTKQHP